MGFFFTTHLIFVVFLKTRLYFNFSFIYLEHKTMKNAINNTWWWNSLRQMS